MTLTTHRKIKVFYSYSHKDEGLRDKLEEHISLLKRQDVIAEWHDRKISGGSNIDDKINENLNDADIILLLVSSSFVASDYCYNKEMDLAMERHNAGEARVIPIILRPCEWHEAPFGALAAFPTDGKPITKWENDDDAFLDVAKGIRKVAEELQNPKPQVLANESEIRKTPKVTVKLPAPVVRFVPRHDEEGKNFVEKIRQSLAESEYQTVVLWGSGGVGKTTLAAQIARASEHEKQIVWIDADSRTEISVGILLDEIATQLGHPETRQLPPTMKRQETLSFLTETPSLVVLDNFETLKPEYQAECLDFLKTREFSSLITTRERLEGVRNENIFEMSEEEAADFLDRLIKDSTFPHIFNEEIRNKTIQTAERNPLVMQWIVGQIGAAQSPQEVFEELEHGEGDAAERVFNRSFNLPQLGNDGRNILLALSLFVQSARRKSVKAIVGFGEDKKRFNKALKSLVNLRLLNVTEGSERLFLGGLTRQFAKAQLVKSQNLKTYRQKFIRYFDNFSGIHQNPTIDDLNLLEEERINLFSAIDLAFEVEGWASAFSISGRLSGFLDIRGYWEDLVLNGNKNLDLAKSLNSGKEVYYFSNILGNAYNKLGNINKAEHLYKDALEVTERIGNQANTAIVLGNLGNLSNRRGNLDEAEALYNEALEIFRKVNDQLSLATLLGNLGNIASRKGNFDKAEKLNNEALQISRNVNNQPIIADSIVKLGALAIDRGNLDEAERFINEGLEIAKKLGDQLRIAIYMSNLSELYFLQKDINKSETACLLSLEIVEKLKHIQGISANKLLLGQIFQVRGDFDTAQKSYEESLANFRQLGYKMQIALTLKEFASLAEAKAEKDTAIEYLKESLEIFEKIGSPKAKKVSADLERLEGKLNQDN